MFRKMHEHYFCCIYYSNNMIWQFHNVAIFIVVFVSFIFAKHENCDSFVCCTVLVCCLCFCYISTPFALSGAFSSLSFAFNARGEFISVAVSPLSMLSSYTLIYAYMYVLIYMLVSYLLCAPIRQWAPSVLHTAKVRRQQLLVYLHELCYCCRASLLLCCCFSCYHCCWRCCCMLYESSLYCTSNI